MNRNCWLRPLAAQTELQLLFDGVASDLSAHYEDHPSDREEHLEGRFATFIERSPVHRVESRLARERIRVGLQPIKLSLAANDITSEERLHGADIGMTARLTLPGEMNIHKAILAQSKRLHQDAGEFTQDCEYSEVFRLRNNSLTPQWDRMIEQTPESVYFLYGPERLRIGRSVKPFGVRVMTAQAIKGMSESGERRLTASMAYERGQPFGEWVVDEMICCNKGDTRRSAVETALGHGNFPVRNAFQIEMYTDPDFQLSQFTNGL